MLLVLVLFIGLVAALATWVAGTLLGIVAPGGGASPPTALAVVLVATVLGLAVVARDLLGRAVRPLASIADAAERSPTGMPASASQSRARVPSAGWRHRSTRWPSGWTGRGRIVRRSSPT